MTADRTKLLTAYALAELDSLSTAMRLLDDPPARLYALELNRAADEAALAWMRVSGIDGPLGIPNADHLLDMLVVQARTYLTEHARELDRVLAEIRGEEG